MRVILQRVSEASVHINNKCKSNISHGLVILLGINPNDTQEDITWLCKKICSLRIFSDISGKMNLSLIDVCGEILLISQFTLFASTKKGNRPSFLNSATPTLAIPLYQSFIKSLETHLGKSISTGVFGAEMKVQLINEGPVTIHLDSKNKE
jgi:D-tyrosyl-tRNA(Tyr) deacylase|tara:strand:+ start:51 stop:503 length:453 start_codon:yes stop_codon:yes gene_type:complete